MSINHEANELARYIEHKNFYLQKLRRSFGGIPTLPLLTGPNESKRDKALEKLVTLIGAQGADRLIRYWEKRMRRTRLIQALIDGQTSITKLHSFCRSFLEHNFYIYSDLDDEILPEGSADPCFVGPREIDQMIGLDRRLELLSAAISDNDQNLIYYHLQEVLSVIDSEITDLLWETLS